MRSNSVRKPVRRSGRLRPFRFQPGNQLPAIPRHRVKVGIDYAVTDVWKVGGNALFVSSQYFVGDESNQYSKLPSYPGVQLSTPPTRSAKNIQLYGRVDNVFDKRYATYGHVLRPRSLAQFHQRRHRLHRPALAEPGDGRARSMRGCG